MLGLQTRPYLQATKSVIKPDAEQRDEGSIYLGLARASGFPIFGSKVAQKFFEFLIWINSLGKSKVYQKSIPQTFLLNLLLKITRQKGFRRLLKFKHGILRPVHTANDFLDKRMVTDDGLVDLAPSKFMDQAKKLEEDFMTEMESKSQFKLITRRAVTTHNSWTHNYEEFVQGSRHTNYLYMNSRDAKDLHLSDGDMVDVSTKTATVRLPLRLDDDLGLKTVALPHGWGHQASGLSVAGKTKGVNVNVLAADGPENIEKVSGMVHLTGFNVEVKKSTGPQQHNSWSGLEEDIWSS
jgi:anaerobic selenocysteine-containing dehydrogenase